MKPLQFAMKHLNKAPEDAQKCLISALIKELVIHDDHIEVKMYVGEPEDILEASVESTCTETSSKKQKNPASNNADGAVLTAQGWCSPRRQRWLPAHPQNPNFFYEVILGLTNAKSKDRWIILN